MRKSQLKELTKFVLSEIYMEPQPDDDPPEEIKKAAEGFIDMLGGMLSSLGIDVQRGKPAFRDTSGFKGEESAPLKNPNAGYKMTEAFWRMMVINVKNTLIALVKDRPDLVNVAQHKIGYNRDYMMRLLGWWLKAVIAKEQRKNMNVDLKSVPHVRELFRMKEEIERHTTEMVNQLYTIFNSIVGPTKFKSILNAPGIKPKQGDTEYNHNWVNAENETKHLMEIMREMQLEIRNYYELLNKVMSS